MYLKLLVSSLLKNLFCISNLFQVASLCAYNCACTNPIWSVGRNRTPFMLLSLFSGLSAQPFRSQQISCIGDLFKNERNLLLYSYIIFCSPHSQNDTNRSLNCKGSRSPPSAELLQELLEPIGKHAERGILKDAVKGLRDSRRSVCRKTQRANPFLLRRSDSLSSETDNE